MMSDSLETFLLCSAALANLTSMSPVSLNCVSSTNMIYILMSHPASSATSVYILEQLVTIFVNLGRNIITATIKTHKYSTLRMSESTLIFVDLNVLISLLFNAYVLDFSL